MLIRRAPKFTQATLRSHSASLHSGHLTRDKRKIARLAIFPNFLRSAPKTSFIPDVKLNTKISFLLTGLFVHDVVIRCRLLSHW